MYIYIYIYISLHAYHSYANLEKIEDPGDGLEVGTSDFCED